MKLIVPFLILCCLLLSSCLSTKTVYLSGDPVCVEAIKNYPGSFAYTDNTQLTDSIIAMHFRISEITISHLFDLHIFPDDHIKWMRAMFEHEKNRHYWPVIGLAQYGNNLHYLLTTGISDLATGETISCTVHTIITQTKSQQEYVL